MNKRKMRIVSQVSQISSAGMRLRMKHLLYSKILEEWKESEYKNKNISRSLKEEIEKSDLKLIVLDDDPTGIQTVHGVYVYTDWSYESIYKGFTDANRLFFILTNSRGLTEQQTTLLHREITSTIMKVSKETKKRFLIISRGDSTLRGHYPLETSLIKEELERLSDIKVDGEIIIPFFKAGGRYTIDNIHYVKYGDELIPAAETEFAKDKTFGYTKSDLCEYIEEKTQGATRAQEVIRIGLSEIRNGEVELIEERLCKAADFRKIIVNAIEPEDLEIFCVALYRALQKGKFFLFRTAADFVRVVGGISIKPFLTKADMLNRESSKGGIVVIGSHTAKTTAQLEALKDMKQLEFIEFDSDLVLEDRLNEEVLRVTKLSSSYIEAGKTVVVYTKRKLLSLKHDTKEMALLRSVKISEAVMRLVGELTTVPKFVIAKGGITSSDIGVKALRVQRAYVLGQVLSGIPVWRTDNTSRFPLIPYIIFPGNVGEADSLKRVLEEFV